MLVFGCWIYWADMEEFAAESQALFQAPFCCCGICYYCLTKAALLLKLWTPSCMLSKLLAWPPTIGLCICLSLILGRRTTAIDSRGILLPPKFNKAGSGLFFVGSKKSEISRLWSFSSMTQTSQLTLQRLDYQLSAIHLRAKEFVTLEGIDGALKTIVMSKVSPGATSSNKSFSACLAPS